jgi:hypothetical protein
MVILAHITKPHQKSKEFFFIKIENKNKTIQLICHTKLDPCVSLFPSYIVEEQTIFSMRVILIFS